MKIIQLLSGGLDSTTLLYKLLNEGHDVHALSIIYGQRHEREMIAAGETCAKLNVPWLMLNLDDLKTVMQGSSLTDEIDVPLGHYAEESMKQTVVPNRNMIFLSIAAAYAISLKSDGIAYAAHAGDHAIYPDCRQPFINSLAHTLSVANMWNKPLIVLAPFINMSKIQILKEGLLLDVDYSRTWTCYNGGSKPCMQCGACVERIEAFLLNNTEDPLLKESDNDLF